MGHIACIRHANSNCWNLFTFAKAEHTHAERMSKTWHKHEYNPTIICPRMRAFRNCHNFDNRSKTREVIALLVFGLIWTWVLSRGKSDPNAIACISLHFHFFHMPSVPIWRSICEVFGNAVALCLHQIWWNGSRNTFCCSYRNDPKVDMSALHQFWLVLHAASVVRRVYTRAFRIADLHDNRGMCRQMAVDSA